MAAFTVKLGVRALLVLSFALVFLSAVNGAYKFEKGGDRKSLYKYYYRPYTLRTESVHPNWWKRDGKALAKVGAGDSGEWVEPGMLGLPAEMCEPKNFWRIQEKTCIPYYCLMDNQIGEVKEGDCVCLLPYIGCKTF